MRPEVRVNRVEASGDVLGRCVLLEIVSSRRALVVLREGWVRIRNANVLGARAEQFDYLRLGRGAVDD
jgi:hypothetical protein